MPRLPRYILPDQPQHVIQRGNNRCAIFRRAQDYAFYQNRLGDACQRFGCEIHAYVLMTNHVHLLMTPRTGDGVAKVMQSLGRHYVGYFNTRHRRTGTLWEGRYRAAVIDSERYLLTCMRYIELNPVRAGLASRPGDYRYSSFAGNALGTDDPLLTPHRVYRRLGETAAEARRAYRALFRARLADATVADIRAATNKAWVLGDERFKAKIQGLSRRRAAPKAKGGDRKSEAFRDAAKINRV